MILLFNEYKKKMLSLISIYVTTINLKKKKIFLSKFFTKKRRHSIEFTRFESLFFLFDNFIVVDNFSITIDNDSKQFKNKKRTKKIASKKKQKFYHLETKNDCSSKKTIKTKIKRIKFSINKNMTI